ncbi:GHKL domain-containing protein [Mycobacteroides chelonae]|uniref:GHKL domain-containing protein n=1 Tax=Mycobacteroides chelonae TaxID=1774 RepID=UPI0009A33A16|nr:GHKL domain-containing protein [Mycobacteroides chelonae]MBF9316380.1 sensor histidine kinase [Mycobacteroides chelonae]
MTNDEFVNSLKSGLPSERMQAAQWAIEARLGDEMRGPLLDAANREGVPRIRRAITMALNNIDSARVADAPADVQEIGSEIAVILNELSGIIRHEMQPAIGWVRYSASRELSDFESSATNRAIEALRKRVDGLSSLAAAHRLPTKQIVSLSEAISESLSDEYPSSMFKVESDYSNDEIYTDPGLLSLILNNAIHNAIEASHGLNEGILITTNVTPDSFWITVRNRFLGTTFEYSRVSATGRTSKSGHRGLGTTIIELCARRLGYQFDLQASGGTATFSLRGKRYA